MSEANCLAGGEGGIGWPLAIASDALWAAHLREDKSRSVDPGFSSLRPADTVRKVLLGQVSLSAKSNWRRGRDSNPRYLAVHCISNAARSTTLPPLLCYQLEGASKGGQGVGQGRRKCIIRGREAQRLGGTDNLRSRGWEAHRHGMPSGVPAFSGQPSLWASGPLTTLTSRRPSPRSLSGRRCG